MTRLTAALFPEPYLKPPRRGIRRPTASSSPSITHLFFLLPAARILKPFTRQSIRPVFFFHLSCFCCSPDNLRTMGRPVSYDVCARRGPLPLPAVRRNFFLRPRSKSHNPFSEASAICPTEFLPYAVFCNCRSFLLSYSLRTSLDIGRPPFSKPQTVDFA